MIESNCPSCQSRLKAPPGVKVSCPSCKTIFTMPVAPPAPPPEVVDAVMAAEDLPSPAPPVLDKVEPTEPQPRRRRRYADEVECPECGQVNGEDAASCRKCGYPLRRRRRGGGEASGIEALIPYKNAWALWSYYLGVFSVIPCIAIPLGIAALVTGIKGLTYASANPEVKGQVHAWVGIIVGGLCLLANIVVIILIVVTSRH